MNITQITNTSLNSDNTNCFLSPSWRHCRTCMVIRKDLQLLTATTAAHLAQYLHFKKTFIFSIYASFNNFKTRCFGVIYSFLVLGEWIDSSWLWSDAEDANVTDIIICQLSKMWTQTPPRLCNAWWSQENLSFYRMEEKKNFCG